MAPLHRQLLALHLRIHPCGEWLATERLAGTPGLVEQFDASVCAPGSPNENMAGALDAVRHAREQGQDSNPGHLPAPGTGTLACGGPMLGYGWGG
jgi:hypothetical protein